MSQIKVVVAGAAGRMGRANVSAVLNNPATILAGAIEHDQSSALGQDAAKLAGFDDNGVLITSDAKIALTGANVLIDFTTPTSSLKLNKLCGELGVAHVIGTTGCTPDDDATFVKSGQNARVLKAGNYSLGVNLLVSLVKKAAAALDDDFDIEVIEMHHNRKVDAPSGTAIMLGEAAANGREIALSEKAVMSREGITGAREKGSIGFATLRGGNVVGDHTVMFVSDSERIELTHKAQDRGLFSAGALKAAIWIVQQPNGFYDMADVLGLND